VLQAASGHFTLFPDLAARNYNYNLQPFSSPIITYADIVKAIKASPFGTATTATQHASFRTQGKGKDKVTQTANAQDGRLVFTQAKNKKILVTSEDNSAYIIKVGGVSSGRISQTEISAYCAKTAYLDTHALPNGMVLAPQPNCI
jgi:hypothetical protein